jgi:fructose-bisphosphate aldolase class II
MTLAALPDLLAADHGLGAFNVVLLEHAEAIVAGAERAGAPVVLQISENCIRYHGSLAPLTSAAPCTSTTSKTRSSCARAWRSACRA